jgi:hypothetical protein
VNSSKDIEERVNYFNENPEKREELLKELEYKFSVIEFERGWKTILSTYI